MIRAALAIPILAAAVYLSTVIDDLRRLTAHVNNWMSVDKVIVFSAEEGDPIKISVYRDIKQEFYADWTVVVRQVEDTGAITIVCESSGRAPYDPKAKKLLHVDLDWWMTPAKCRPSPGKYRVDSAWRIYPEGYPEKILRVDSNLFYVLPKVK